jgi:midasin
MNIKTHKPPAGAHAAWFHLLRLVDRAVAGEGDDRSGDGCSAGADPTASPAAVTPAALAALAEQFMQSAPLGEYAGRLGLLRAFAGHAKAVAARPTSSPAAVARATSAVLTNVASLFALHAPAVAAAAEAALAPLAKQLADFVALARWEDRGYYANRAAAEKAARHLHRLSRRARAALAAPSAPVLAGAGATMGLPDLEPGAIVAAAVAVAMPAAGVRPPKPEAGGGGGGGGRRGRR